MGSNPTLSAISSGQCVWKWAFQKNLFLQVSFLLTNSQLVIRQYGFSRGPFGSVFDQNEEALYEYACQEGSDGLVRSLEVTRNFE